MALIAWAVATATRTGEAESGERHLVMPGTNGAVVAVVARYVGVPDAPRQ